MRLLAPLAACALAACGPAADAPGAGDAAPPEMGAGAQATDGGAGGEGEAGVDAAARDVETDSAAPDAPADAISPRDGGLGPIARVTISLQSYWQGPSRWHATAAQMSPAQASIVQGFAVIPAAAPQSSCPSSSDGDDYVVTLDLPAGPAVYHANGLDADCGGAGAVLAWATFKPILATYKCLSGQQTQTATSVAMAVSLSPDPLCDDGVFATQPTEEIWFKLEVPAPGTHQAREIDCASIASSLTLYDATGTTPLATASSADAGACPAVSYPFTAGTYALKLAKTAGCCQMYLGFE